MTCPQCQSVQTHDRTERTELCYRRFRCRACGREFNERRPSKGRLSRKLGV